MTLFAVSFSHSSKASRKNCLSGYTNTRHLERSSATTSLANKPEARNAMLMQRNHTAVAHRWDVHLTVIVMERRWIYHWVCDAWPVRRKSDLRLPSQSQSITAFWSVSNYTAWWQRHMLNDFPRVVKVEQLRVKRTTSWLLVQRGNALTVTLPRHVNEMGKGNSLIPIKSYDGFSL